MIAEVFNLHLLELYVDARKSVPKRIQEPRGSSLRLDSKGTTSRRRCTSFLLRAMSALLSRCQTILLARRRSDASDLFQGHLPEHLIQAVRDGLTMEKEKRMMVLSKGAMVVDAAVLRKLLCLGWLHEGLIILLVRFHSNVLDPKSCLRTL